MTERECELLGSWVFDRINRIYRIWVAGLFRAEAQRKRGAVLEFWVAVSGRIIGLIGRVVLIKTGGWGLAFA